jgi:hypothetical protein
VSDSLSSNGVIFGLGPGLPRFPAYYCVCESVWWSLADISAIFSLSFPSTSFVWRGLNGVLKSLQSKWSRIRPVVYVYAF